MIWPALSPADEFPLWGFLTERGAILTRGRTEAEARHHMRNFRRARPMRDLPIDAPSYYERNHRPGWLRTPMYWLCEALGLDPREHGHA